MAISLIIRLEIMKEKMLNEFQLKGKKNNLQKWKKVSEMIKHTHA